MIPRAASGGQLEDPWEENLYFATWLLFPNLVEILEDNIQLIVLSSFFFSSPWCFWGIHSQQPRKLRGWQMAIRKTRVPRKSAEGSKLTRRGGEEGMKTEQNKLIFWPQSSTKYVPIYSPWNLRDSRWKHFHLFLLSLYFIGILVVSIWKFPCIGLKKKLKQLLRMYGGK